MSSFTGKTIRMASIQMMVGMDKTENVSRALNLIRQAVSDKSKPVHLVALPESFNCPYSTKYFKEFSETIPDGYTSVKLSQIAKELGIYLLAGTIPERDATDPNVVYNTCTVWSPTGELIAKHRKMHLFDMDVVGGCRFKESDVFTAGKDFTTFNIGTFKIGVNVCFDIRFDEMARVYRMMGCDMLVYPAAFDMGTGPIHWEILQRGRANDLQLYVATISAARDLKADYVAWGHSMVVDPWAKVVVEAGDGEEIIYADIDTTLNAKVRAQIPISVQRRPELYSKALKQ